MARFTPAELSGLAAKAQSGRRIERDIDRRFNIVIPHAARYTLSELADLSAVMQMWYTRVEIDATYQKLTRVPLDSLPVDVLRLIAGWLSAADGSALRQCSRRLARNLKHRAVYIRDNNVLRISERPPASSCISTPAPLLICSRGP